MNKIIRRTFYSFSNAKNVVIEYQDLKNGKNLTQLIQKAYGPKGLGILFVNGIPDYVQARRQTLPTFWKLGNLPTETLNKYVRPDILYARGWSRGVQHFQGIFDHAKASYYVNCAFDKPPVLSEQQQKLFTEQQLLIMNSANIWVDQLPQLEKNVKFLSSVILKTGSLLSEHIDEAVSKNVRNYRKGRLSQIVKTTKTKIGRILHYYPFEQKGTSQADWCGWHNDYGIVTGLTSAMYIDQNGKQVQLKQQSGGLYAKDRNAKMTRISIPKNMLAFQLGQGTQIMSGGYLEATPHCVVRNQQIAGKGISRQTFALFMDPDSLEPLNVPEGSSEDQIKTKPAYGLPQLRKRWKNGMLYKQFLKATYQSHY